MSRRETNDMYILGLLFFISLVFCEYAKHWRHFLIDVHYGVPFEDRYAKYRKNFNLALNKNDSVYFEVNKLCEKEKIKHLKLKTDVTLSNDSLDSLIADITAHCTYYTPHLWMVRMYGMTMRTAKSENMLKTMYFKESPWAKRKYMIKKGSDKVIYGLVGGAFIVPDDKKLPADSSDLYSNQPGKNYAGKKWEKLTTKPESHSSDWPLQYVLDAKGLLLQLDGDTILVPGKCILFGNRKKFRSTKMGDFILVTHKYVNKDVLFCVPGKYVVLLSVQEENFFGHHGTRALFYSFKTLHPGYYPEIYQGIGTMNACDDPIYAGLTKDE